MSRMRVTVTVADLDQAREELEQVSGERWSSDPSGQRTEEMIRCGTKVIEIRTQLAMARLDGECAAFDRLMKSADKAWMLLPAFDAGAIFDNRRLLVDHGVSVHDIWYLKMRFWYAIRCQQEDQQSSSGLTEEAKAEAAA